MQSNPDSRKLDRVSMTAGRFMKFNSILCIYDITHQHQLSISRHLDIKVSGVYRCLNAMIKHWIPKSSMALLLQNPIWAYISEKTTHADLPIISKYTNKQHTVSYTTCNISYYKINHKLYAKEITKSRLSLTVAQDTNSWNCVYKQPDHLQNESQILESIQS